MEQPHSICLLEIAEADVKDSMFAWPILFSSKSLLLWAFVYFFLRAVVLEEKKLALGSKVNQSTLK